MIMKPCPCQVFIYQNVALTGIYVRRDFVGTPTGSTDVIIGFDKTPV